MLVRPLMVNFSTDKVSLLVTRESATTVLLINNRGNWLLRFTWSYVVILVCFAIFGFVSMHELMLSLLKRVGLDLIFLVGCWMFFKC